MKISLNSKEIESLKWKYLKCSELYKEYCEFQREKEKKHKLILPDKFQPAKGTIQDINPIIMTFTKYGDIHNQSFETWYYNYFEDDKKGTQIPYKDIHFCSVDDLSGVGKAANMKYFLRNTFIFIIDNYKKVSGDREPSLLEMAELLRYQMYREREFQSYLKIKQSDFTTEEVNKLTNEVKKILMQKVPAKRFVKDEMERYLRIYIMRKSTPPVSFRDIHKKEFPRDKDYTENHRRARINDFNKAKKIINNIEKNIDIWW